MAVAVVGDSQPDVKARLLSRWRAILVWSLALVALVWWVLGQMELRSFWLQLLNGLSFGAVLLFVASGFTLIFGLMRITNLAHGGFYLVGGYVGFTVIQWVDSFAAALLGAAVFVAVLGLVVERGLLRRVRGQTSPEVLLTIGLAFVLGDMSLAIWGGDPTPIPLPEFLQGPLRIGDFAYPRYRIFVIICAVAVTLVLFFAERRTKFGAIVRAGVDDRETVAALGININLIFTAVFMFGAFLVGFAGVIGGGFLTLLPGQDFEILLFALVVVILGGLGSLPGAVLGAVLVGLIDSFGKSLFPELSFFTIFAPMALILLVRPEGLLGKKQ